MDITNAGYRGFALPYGTIPTLYLKLGVGRLRRIRVGKMRIYPLEHYSLVLANERHGLLDLAHKDAMPVHPRIDLEVDAGRSLRSLRKPTQLLDADNGIRDIVQSVREHRLGLRVSDDEN